VAWITGKFQQRLRGASEQEIVNDLLVSEHQRIEYVREGEDHMEVMDGKHILLSFLKPLLPFKKLALRTMPVPAGII
jgi:hypothetical protein